MTDKYIVKKFSEFTKITDPVGTTFAGFKTGVGDIQIDFSAMSPLFGVTGEKGQSITLAINQQTYTNETNNINTAILEKNKVVKNGDIITKDGQYLMIDNGTVNLETGVTSETFDNTLLVNANALSYDTGGLLTSSVSHCSDLLPIGNIVRIKSNNIGTVATVAAITFYNASGTYLKDISVAITDAATKDGVPDSRVAFYRVSRSTSTQSITLYKKSTVTGQIENKDAITLITVTGGAYTTAKLHDIPYSNLMYGTPSTTPLKGYSYLVGTGTYTKFRLPGSSIFDASLFVNANAIDYNTGALITSSVSHSSNLLPMGNIIRIHSNQVGTATGAAVIAFYDSNSNYLKDISVSVADSKIKDGIPDSRVAFYRVARSTTDDIILYTGSESVSTVSVFGWGLFIYDEANDIWDFEEMTASSLEQNDKDNYLVFKGGVDLSVNTFRIPCVEITNKGTLLCAGEARYISSADAGQPIEIVIKRSTNNGATWSDAQVIIQRNRTITNSRVNGASIMVDRITGRIYVFGTKMDTGADDSTIFTDGWWQTNSDLVYVYSDDDGLTWSALQSIKTMHPEIYPQNTVNVTSPSSANGITMQNGTIVIPIQIRRTYSGTGTTGNARFHSAFIYLTPEDKKTLNWKRSSLIEMGWNGEPQLIEYEPGKIMINARGSYTNRRVYITEDMGLTWQLHPSDLTIPNPSTTNKFNGCNASIELMRLGNEYFLKQYYLYTRPASSAEYRIDPTLYITTDLITFTEVLKLYSGNTWGYTSIAFYNGKLVIAYETLTDIYVTVLNPYLLTAKYYQ